jgi:FMN phosphatase YigB (HAD superfamily)
MSEPVTVRPPRLIVFDLGGVLIRICRTWAEACTAAGLPVRGEELAARRSDLAHRHGLGEISSDEFFRLVSEALTGAYSPPEVRRVHDAWLLDEYPGVHELIADIHAAGLSTGVLSNTNHAHWVRLAPPSRGGIGEFASPGLVHHLHASHIMRLLKPDAAIYAEFERLSGSPPGEILFFDDMEENVLAARARGWQSELVDHAGDTAAQMRGVLRGLGVRL